MLCLLPMWLSMGWVWIYVGEYVAMSECWGRWLSEFSGYVVEYVAMSEYWGGWLFDFTGYVVEYVGMSEFPECLSIYW